MKAKTAKKPAKSKPTPKSKAKPTREKFAPAAPRARVRGGPVADTVVEDRQEKPATAKATKARAAKPKAAPAAPPEPAGPPPAVELPSPKEQEVIDVLLAWHGEPPPEKQRWEEKARPKPSGITALSLCDRSKGALTRGSVYKTLQRMPAGLLDVTFGGRYGGPPSGYDDAQLYALSEHGLSVAHALLAVRAAMAAAKAHAKPLPQKPKRPSWRDMVGETSATRRELLPSQVDDEDETQRAVDKQRAGASSFTDWLKKDLTANAAKVEKSPRGRRSPAQDGE